jgi:hypothetical protein
VRSLRSRGRNGSRSWLLCHAGLTNAVDRWAQTPLVVSRVSHSLDGENAEAFGIQHTILGVGFDRPLQLPPWFK